MDQVTPSPQLLTCEAVGMAVHDVRWKSQMVWRNALRQLKVALQMGST